MARAEGPSTEILRVKIRTMRVMVACNTRSNAIVGPEDEFSVTVRFEVQGPAPVEDEYRIDYLYEELGNGPEGILGRVIHGVQQGKQEYRDPETTLAVRGGWLGPGRYMLSAVVQLGEAAYDQIEGPIILVQESR